MILNGSTILMTYLFLLADQIFLELIQSAIIDMLEWIFHENCQICMLKNGMQRLTFTQKEDNIKYISSQF